MTTKHFSILRASGLKRALGALLTVGLAASLAAQQIATVVSSGLHEPNYITTDPNGLVYVTDSSNNRIIEYDPATTVVTPLAGSLTFIAGTNNGAGSAALFSQPLGIVYDSYRNGLVVVDQGNQVLRYVSLSGVVSNLAGVEATQFNTLGGDSDGPAASAQFRFPVGIATDTASNLYIADTGNNAIRRLDVNNQVSTLTVLNYNFHGPTALAVDNNNNLWVADTRNDTICVISNISVFANQTVYTIAGSLGQYGTNDSVFASNALFDLPSGLFWDSSFSGLLISDTANNTLRRLFPNTTSGGYSVETVAGLPGKAGDIDGATTNAELNNPVGLASDLSDNGYFVVDRGNNALRRYQTGPPLPPVANPIIGLVTFPPHADGSPPTSVFVALPNEANVTFNTNPIVAIENPDTNGTVFTYFIRTNSPTNQFTATPVPGPTSTPANVYAGDGQTPGPNNTVSLFPPVGTPQTIYVISEAHGRASSQVISASFNFITGSPTILGANAATVELEDANTPNAQLYLTVDGSLPNPANANNIGGPVFGPFPAGTNVDLNSLILSPPLFSLSNQLTLTVVATLSGFANSPPATSVFFSSNDVPNQISFGFASGEASSEFVGSAGDWFIAPVTLSLLPSASIYSLQFNVSLTNLNGAPSAAGDFVFQSMMDIKVLLNGQPLYIPIPPDVFTNGGFQSLLFTNASQDLLGVGWLEVFGETNLYDTTKQQLITYSQAHETVFLGTSGQTVVGSYAFRIPASATANQVYQIQIGRPSADSDGFAQNVFIQAPTNTTVPALGPGTINGVKNVTIGSVHYLVGDVAPFRWFNAGDFGDTNLLNNDVLETFRSAVYNLNTPPTNSDFYDAMDSSDAAINNNFYATDAQINSIMMGDGVLDVSDVYVTYRRSLDPSLTWYARFWSGGVKSAVAVPNVIKENLPPAKQNPVKLVTSGPRYITVGADRVQGSAGQTVQVPVRVLVADSLPIRVLMLNVDLVPLDGSPTVTNAVAFTPAVGLGSPTMSLSQGPQNYAAAWLDSTATGVSGTAVIGTVSVTLPPNANNNSSYLIHFEHFSASPNGIADYHATVQDGLITVGSARSASSWNDGIPDWWRLVYFGTVSNLLSAANLDPDGDGASNWQEYVAGTNPMDPASVLLASPAANTSVNFTVQWPSVLGKTYSVQSSTSLFSTNWTVIATNLAGTGQNMQIQDGSTPAPPARFYRVQAQ